jgi:hypothetical protein
VAPSEASGRASRNTLSCFVSVRCGTTAADLRPASGQTNARQDNGWRWGIGTQIYHTRGNHHPSPYHLPGPDHHIDAKCAHVCIISGILFSQETGKQGDQW